MANVSLFSLLEKNAGYKKSARKDIKGRKMTLVEEEREEVKEGEEEEDMEIWTYHCQDDQVRVPLQNRCFY